MPGRIIDKNPAPVQDLRIEFLFSGSIGANGINVCTAWIHSLFIIGVRDGVVVTRISQSQTFS